jgi:prepilin-type N-terminal cleavage/methylation domain-containing protein
MPTTLTRAVPPAPTFGQRGFTLIELAIVMFIVALLVGGMLLPLSAQRDIRSLGDTQKILADTRDALLGFAVANERLPCPASAASNGRESYCTFGAAGGPCGAELFVPQPHGRCKYFFDGVGFVPAVTLGLAPIDAQGYLVDGWGGDAANRVRYALSAANNNAYSTPSGMKTSTMTTLAPASVDDLTICRTGNGIAAPGTAADCAVATDRLARDAVAVVYSLGKNAGTEGASADEKHNPNPQSAHLDPVFVSAEQGATFDDQMIWLSKNTLFNRMVTAGRLP